MSQTQSPLSAPELGAAIQVADREQASGNFEAAAAIYRLVLKEIPQYVDGQAKLARALFCLRRWDEAWPAFNMRFQLMDVPPKVTLRKNGGAPTDIPRTWRGPPPKKLLVLSEQGMGDTIQFARFLPRLLESGVDLQVVVPQRVIGLLRTLDPCPPLLAGEMPGSLASVENWATMMDLPHMLGLKEEDYLAREPYLSPDPARIEHWRPRIADHDGPVVAFAWRGNPEHKLDGTRSATLEDFAPLARIENVKLVCLQMNATDDEIAACSFADKITRPGLDFDTGPDAFLDTAAILACVDRLVSVDTSLVHVAGAIHCQVDMLLAKDWADWRWLDVEDFNVWYPTMKLRRRRAHDAWSDVVARVAADIAPEAAQVSDKRDMVAPTSAGDLVDRIIRLDQVIEDMGDGERRVRAKAHRDALLRAFEQSGAPASDAREARSRLTATNRRLRALRADLRDAADAAAIAELARALCAAEDERVALIGEIDAIAHSLIVHEDLWSAPAPKAAE